MDIVIQRKKGPEGLVKKTSKFGLDAIGRRFGGMQTKIKMNLCDKANPKKGSCNS
jgi:hypothetical protein